MPVAYITGNGAASQLVSSLDTGTFTIGSQTDKALVVVVSWNTPVGETISSVVWDPAGVNEALTAFSSVYNVGNRYLRAYARVAPSAVTGGIVRCTWSGATIGAQGVTGALFSGVDQTTPLSDQTTATGTSTSASVTVSAAGDDDYLIDIINSVVEPTVGADQTQVFQGAVGDYHATSVQDGSIASDALTWSMLSSDVWLQLAVRVNAASGGGGRTSKNTRGTEFGMELGVNMWGGL